MRAARCTIVREWQEAGIKTSLGNEWTTRSLKVMLCNPRMCGLRELDGELVRDMDDELVRGQWKPIITVEEWTAIRTIFDSRKGYFIGRDMKIMKPHQPDYRDHSYLLSGILRCGRTQPDGKPCNTPLRVTRKKGVKHHSYACLSKAEGGCGRLSRRGDLVDEYVSEAVLAKLEEAAFTASAGQVEWGKEDQLKDVVSRLDELTAQWNAGNITNNFFFKLAPGLEKEIARLRAESANFAGSAKVRQARAGADVADIRRRWNLPEKEGGFPISRKRAYIREALHTVIVYPASKGPKTFNPDLLYPVWRED
ncbi:recombinase family protein [Streptosporangium saharense]|uniref:recombinase family protein n=1 Tax=Streptosporangium saharense TaxID=1706840 RepID=UPI0036CCC647